MATAVGLDGMASSAAVIAAVGVAVSVAITCKSHANLQFMASVKIILDKRSKKKDGTNPLKLRIVHNRLPRCLERNAFREDVR